MRSILWKRVWISTESDSTFSQYVILICPFDVYGLGLHKYTFKKLCVEHPELEMGDETEKIVLNTNGTADDVDEKLKNFLDYVAGKTVDDEYVKKVDEAVRKARQNREWILVALNERSEFSKTASVA